MLKAKVKNERRGVEVGTPVGLCRHLSPFVGLRRLGGGALCEFNRVERGKSFKFQVQSWENAAREIFAARSDRVERGRHSALPPIDGWFLPGLRRRVALGRRNGVGSGRRLWHVLRLKAYYYE
jgi:hypothetical protein